MIIELYLQSAYEEYAKMHMCRSHWNYQWSGRKGRFPNDKISTIKMRKEEFGGLVQNTDGRIYKTDKKGVEVIQRLMNRQSLYNISNEMNVDKYELDNFVSKLQEIGIRYYGQR